MRKYEWHNDKTLALVRAYPPGAWSSRPLTVTENGLVVQATTDERVNADGETESEVCVDIALSVYSLRAAGWTVR